MARLVALLVALVFATAAVLGVSWFLYQDDHGTGVWALVLGLLFFVAPLLAAVIYDDPR